MKKTAHAERDPGKLMISGLLLLGLPRQAIDEALATTDRKNRSQGRFSDHAVVYFVVLMGLFMELSYDHLIEIFHTAISVANLSFENMATLTNSAVTQARQRITAAPLKALFERICVPLCGKDAPYAHFGKLRIVLIDGSSFQVADSEENAAAYGKSANQNGESGLPLVNTVTVVEYGSRAPLDFAFGPYRKGSSTEPASEQSLCKLLLSRLKPDQLCIGDRLYANYENCKAVIEANSHFLFRVRNDVKLTPVRELPDGSYEARFYLYINRKRQKQTYITVRVLEYGLKGETGWHRLVTNLGLEEGSINELVQLYPLRWTEETIFREIKATLKPTRLALRSRSPEMVAQELYGVFIAYYLVRRLMFVAAIDRNYVPEELSFKHALFVTREISPKVGDFPPSRVTKSSNHTDHG